jgi:carbon-monoxide dehydrogenase large subunit/6-hydroxypseudooxynicotine dehydrogenase subunit gamma
MQEKFVGRSAPRLEDRPLVTGAGRFAADVSFPHQLHMRVVRSSRAHGRIRLIEIDGARAAPGVAAVWTADHVRDVPPIDFREGRIEHFKPYRQPIVACGYVRYVGEPVAAVFAEDPYLAEDAADLVTMEIEDLPAILSADEPPGEFAPGIHTEPTVIRKEYGDLEVGFRAAHQIIELELRIGRHSGAPLETRGAIARYDAVRDVLELYGAAKVPHRTRDLLAQTLDRSPSSVHLIEGHVGGGFGIRGELYPEDVLVSLAALRLRRPVKWIEDRHEHLMAANHSREQIHRVRVGVDAAGRILALDDEYFHAQGAYIRTHGSRVADMTAGMLPGPYRVPAYRATGHFRLTNKTPAATYRAPGRYEGTFVRERIMDAIAKRLKLDPIAVRRVNLIAKNEMPFRRPLTTLDEETVYDSGDYAGLLDKTLKAFDWAGLNADVRQRRAKGEAVGVGLAMFVEKSGIGPADGVKVSVDTSGAVEVLTGGASLGQGFETAMAQICADALGIDYRRIRVIHGRTDLIAHGIGAHSSRASVITGSATHIAATKVRLKALEVGSELLQTPPEELDVVDGMVVRKGAAGPSVSLAEIARTVAPTSKARGQHEPGLSAEGWFFTDHMVYPYGIHIAVAKVDRETGAVAIERYLVAYDLGRAINPTMVEGQIAGGVAQGMGGALFEEFVYDGRGEPLSLTFADYLVPTCAEMPPVDFLIAEDAPSPRNPLGIKGAGEAGTNAAGAVIAAAIDDAIGIPGAITALPVTPQRLKQILDRHQASVPHPVRLEGRGAGGGPPSW